MNKFYDIDTAKFNQGVYDNLERDLIHNKAAISEMNKTLGCMYLPAPEWFVMNGDKTRGYKCIKNIAKNALDSFNLFCDKVLNSLTLNNCVVCEEKIRDKHNALNESLEDFRISICEDYLRLKIEQLQLTREIIVAKKIQKDIERAERETVREQLKEEKQLAKEKERAENKITKLQFEYNKLSLNPYKNRTKLNNIERELESLNHKVEQSDYALTHGRAGYVYVVSNSDMQKGQYKIGITRRSVEERMRELGSGASHSFGMNVHGYVYSEDCFELEKKLHKYFDKQRVNQVNPRKEWFWTTLEDIKKAFLDVDGIEINLIECNDEEWVYSQERIKV